MKTRMLRTQILLEPEQHQRLLELAQTEKRSLSDLVREMLHAQLETRKQEATRLLQRRLAALAQIKVHRQQLLDRRGGQPLPFQPQQLIEQLREERDEQYFDNFR
jgi:predicted CopG family antitoxin